MRQSIVDATRRAADAWRVPEIYALAFVEVETNGQAFAHVNGEGMALIRWEGHYLWRRLAAYPGIQAEARELGLAHPQVKGVPNPVDQTGRYGLLQRAVDFLEGHGLDRDLAFECISIGLGQVMGSHWRDQNFSSAEAMLDAAHDESPAEDIEDQIDMVFSYLDTNDLLDPLRRGEMDTVFRGYNGSAYKRFGYDKKFWKAVAKWERIGDGVSAASDVLRFGDYGPMVKGLQATLAELGYPVGNENGEFLEFTRAAVLAFQADNNLKTDGIVGPQTWGALRNPRPAQIGAARAKATSRDVARAGSLKAQAARAGQRTAAGAVAVAAGVPVVEQFGALGWIQEQIGRLTGVVTEVETTLFEGQSLYQTVGENWPVLIVGLGILWLLNNRTIDREEVRDYRAGRLR